MKKIAFVALPLTMVLAACGGAETTDDAGVVDPAVTTTEPVIADPAMTDPAMTTDTMATDPMATEAEADATMAEPMVEETATPAE